MPPAVKSPAEEIVPPVADQVTPVFDVPATVAENCWVLPVWTEAEGGLTATVTAAAVGGVLETDPGEPAEPAQPAKLNAEERMHRKIAVLPERCEGRRGELPASWKRANIRSKNMVLCCRRSG